MEILVFGGTRFFGVELVEQLLKQGHQVTIGTRGLAKDHFGDRVKRLRIDRMDGKSLEGIFRGKTYDCIFDNICYASMDVKRLLDVAKCRRYILTSTMSVYQPNHLNPNTKETVFEPLSYPLKWLERPDASYDEVKRQAEAALFQVYGDRDSVAVRFPFVIGKEDYTKRLLFYVEGVVKQEPMWIDNLDAPMSFIEASQAGKFLAWLAEDEMQGSVNGANGGTVSIREILDYVEKKSGKKAIINGQGKPAPYNGTTPYSLDTEKAEKAGFAFASLDSFLWELLDYYIEQVKNA